MSVETTLDIAFTTLLGKAQGTTTGTGSVVPTPAPTTGGGVVTGGSTDRLPVSVNFEWSGGGLAVVLANTDPVKVSIPFPCTIAAARMCAGNGLGHPTAVTASVDVEITQFSTFGSSVALQGSGTIPRLQADSVANCSLTGWQTNLVAGDWLIGRLATFTGSATWVALELILQPISVQLGVSTVVDNTGNRLVDNSGNVIVYRN